jgi:LmbE family N-acetylglucosaminyl deacetylase
VLAKAVELPGDSWFVRNQDLSVSVPDDEVTTEIDATAYLPAKLAAMAAHETQITVDGEFYALSNEIGQRALGTEYYTLLAGPDGSAGGRRRGGPFERDLLTRYPDGSWGTRRAG